MSDAATFALVSSAAILLLAFGFVWGFANAASAPPIVSCDTTPNPYAVLTVSEAPHDEP